VLVPVFGVLYCTVYSYDIRKSILYCLFCLYLAAVFSLVGIPNLRYFRPEVNLNLIPLIGMIGDFKNSILNVILFVPLGLFLPLLWNGYRRLIPGIAFGFGLSLTIELMQMLTYRTTDVNDLITNTAGYLLGFLLVKPMVKRFPAVERNSRDLYLLSILTFAIMFCVHPFLSPFIWDSIL